MILQVLIVTETTHSFPPFAHAHLMMNNFPPIPGVTFHFLDLRPSSWHKSDMTSMSIYPAYMTGSLPRPTLLIFPSLGVLFIKGRADFTFAFLQLAKSS